MNKKDIHSKNLGFTEVFPIYWGKSGAFSRVKFLTNEVRFCRYFSVIFKDLTDSNGGCRRRAHRGIGRDDLPPHIVGSYAAHRFLAGGQGLCRKAGVRRHLYDGRHCPLFSRQDNRLEYKLGETISEEGEYRVTVTDECGNSTVYTFNIEEGTNWTLIVLLVVLGLLIAGGVVFFFIRRKSVADQDEA